MTREDTVSLIRSIVSLYPNWKPENLTETVNAWYWALEDYPAAGIKGALQIYIKTNKTGFAPSVSQLIDAMHAPQNRGELTEGEAWHMVKKAIADSGYHAQERFDELPPLVQKTVGSPVMLKVWGQTDSDEVNTVVMSNFQRSYRAMLSRQEYDNKVPPQLENLVKGLAEKVAPRIGVSE